MNDATVNLNQNQVECIKTTDHLGSTLYTNICTNETYTREWGFSDWGVLVFFAALILIFVAFAAFMVRVLFEEF
jgi:hypothetical protein